ncbi:MAG: three-helix bundle dimerization domain-containing protein [Mycobacterium sp.]
MTAGNSPARAGGLSPGAASSQQRRAASVIVIGHHGHHLTLRVIEPETTEHAAREALAGIPERANNDSSGRTGTAAARSVADVAERLARYEGSDDQRAAEIMRWCEEAAEQFESARIQSFVPILIEHIVHSRMFQTRAAQPLPNDAASGAPQGGD